jgi:hypothetical protein
VRVLFRARLVAREGNGKQIDEMMNRKPAIMVTLFIRRHFDCFHVFIKWNVVGCQENTLRNGLIFLELRCFYEIEESIG